jgi:hypothetical protein
MPAPKRSPTREARIINEIVVDAYTESERALGWYYYLDNRLQFPFSARCVSQRAISPLRRGDEVTVVGMAPEDECMHEMFVRVRREHFALAVPLSQLMPPRLDTGTRLALEDWRYWVARGYCF